MRKHRMMTMNGDMEQTNSNLSTNTTTLTVSHRNTKNNNKTGWHVHSA